MRRASVGARLALVLALAATGSAQEDLARAIDGLLTDRDVAAAKRVLGRHTAEEIVPLAEAALVRETPDARGKRNILALLAGLGREDLVRKAIASDALSTRRAAAAVLPDAPAAKEILLAWLADAKAGDRALAVNACANIAEARPHLVGLLRDSDAPTFAAAVASLSAEPPPELAAVVQQRLANPKEDPVRVAACLDVLPRLGKIDVDRLVGSWLRRRDGGTAVRSKAAFVLRDREALKAVLLDADETDAIVQRNCLYRLASDLDDAELLPLLREERVARHRYFGIRVDVATALACVEGAGDPDLAAILDGLVDVDPEDREHIVRSEAWVTLWTLTGKMHGADPALFPKAPPRGPRECRLRRSFLRAGVSREQARELERLAQDIDRMREVRAKYATR